MVLQLYLVKFAPSKALSSKQKAKETGTAVQPPQQTPPQTATGWEPLTELAASRPAPAAAPSDDLLQLNAVFSAPIQQQDNPPAFSQSAMFPSSAFGQAPVPGGFVAPHATSWGGSTGSTSTWS